MTTPRPPNVWSVYILRCADGTFYTGIAVDVKARFNLHEKGRGARYTRGRAPLALVHVETAGSHGDALRREAAIRKLGRAGKEALAAAAQSATNIPESPAAPAPPPEPRGRRRRLKVTSDPAARPSRS